MVGQQEATPKRSWLPIVLAVVLPLAYVLLTFFGLGALSFVSRRPWEIFRDTGWFGWLNLLAALVGLVVLVGLGLLVTLKPKAWSWPLMIPGMLVALVASLGLQLTMSKVRWAISGESVDASQKARIFAEGFSESLGSIIIGGLMASVVFSAASLVCATRALARVRKRQLGAGPLLAFAAALVTFGVVLGARVFVAKNAAGPPFEILASLSGGLAAVIASTAMWGSPEDHEGHTQAAGDLVVAMLLAVGGVMVATVASRAYGLSMAFHAIGGYSIDPSQRARILAAGWQVANGTTLWGSLFVVPIVTATFVPLMMRTGHAARGFAFAWGGMLGVAIGATLSFAMPRLQSDRIMATIPEMWKVELPSDVQLVEVGSSVRLADVSGALLGVGRDRITYGNIEMGGANRLDSDAGCQQVAAELAAKLRGNSDPQVAVDAAVPFRRLSCLALAWKKQATGISGDNSRLKWVVKHKGETAPSIPPPFDKMISGMGCTIGRDRFTTSRAKPRALHVSSTGLTLGNGPGQEPLRKQGDTQELLAWLSTTIDESSEWELTADPELPASAVLPILAVAKGVVVGVAPAAEVPTDPAVAADASETPTTKTTASVRSGAITVSGRLPPEVIQRIVRANYGKLRTCYEQGLARDPKLQGRVSVRFVIDREGKVSNVGNGGSDLRDDKVTSCVTKTFYGMHFPQPESGIVTVVYPIMFLQN
jgi:hypothetical protein